MSTLSCSYSRAVPLSWRLTAAHLLAVCAAPLTAAGDVEITAEPKFDVRTIHDAGIPVFLLSAANIDSAAEPPALTAVTGDGTVLRLNAAHPEWLVEPLPIKVDPVQNMSMASRPTIDVGDVLPQFPGNEIVIQTADNVTVLYQPTPGDWLKQLAADFSGLIGLHWGARVGEIDPRSPGDEIFYIFEGIFDISTGHVVRAEDDNWNDQMVYMQEVGMDSAIGDVDPLHPGNEIVVTTEMGPTYLITPQLDRPGFWPKRLLWDDFDESGFRTLIADVLPDREGNEIVYGTRYSSSILLSYETATGHVVEKLFEGVPNPVHPPMYDIAVGRIDPSSPALDIVGVDGSGTVTLLQYDGSKWNSRTLWQDPAGPLYAVAFADFLPNCAGDEIVVTGASGAITLISLAVAGLPDLNCDGTVGVADLLLMLSMWGECEGTCSADLDGDGSVGVPDLLLLLGSWG